MGAVDEVMSCCTRVEVKGELIEVMPEHDAKRRQWADDLTSLIIVAGGAWLTVSPLAGALGFVPLPPLYWLYLALMLLGYPYSIP